MRLEGTLGPTPSFADWQRMWLENPVWSSVKDWWTIGWVLEIDGGELVGCMGNVPLNYHFRGERLMVATGRGWVVLPNHRGWGSARKLLDAHFYQPSIDVVLDTSVSQQGSDRASYLSNRIPTGDWESVAYFITEYGGFAARALQKLKIPMAPLFAPVAGMGLRLKDTLRGRRLPPRSRLHDIEVRTHFDSQFDGFWRELLQQKPETVLGVRDTTTLAWHFQASLAHNRLWIFTASRNQQLRAFAIFERKDAANELPQVRLVDYQTIEPETDLLADMLRLALERCTVERICVLDKSGLGVASMKTFDEAAPYRRKQPWPFWCRSPKPELAAELRDPKHWEPTEYDGDASIG